MSEQFLVTHVVFGELQPGLPRSSTTDQEVSVVGATMYGGSFTIAREHPELARVWRGNRTVDSLALKAIGFTDEEADKLLASCAPDDKAPAAMAKPRLRRLMGKNESDVSGNLPGLVGRAFRDGLFVVTLGNVGVSALLESAKDPQLLRADLSNASMGMGRAESARLLGVPDTALGHVRARTLFPLLGVQTMQAAVTRGFLGGVLTPDDSDIRDRK